MASSTIKMLFLIVLCASTIDSMANARPALGLSSSLVARLKLDDESPTCWESLIQLQACTGEIILFFLNGETYIGDSCCHAIRTITQMCWPGMIDTLGFTTEEGNILEGYCVASENSPPPTPAIPSPASTKVFAKDHDHE
ncbi:hypothetical protein K2173_007161 [Erythroxylum novogranatense]|uniref:Prolamin-like domain-containing protein n=1 Tax=Erythroxylum novogranatense TaxID=1862640 RepID=A0AAV8T5Q2_9ROSI|nr:hypothetical protein K2173_007161 [Erythroxylum novogranatense]